MADLTLQSGIASFVAPGNAQCGDRAMVHRFDGGAVVAVIDGLGHGAEAAAAARLAESVVASHAQESPPTLVMRCHEALQQTRGVVMSIARVNLLQASLTWLGVGNVRGLMCRASVPQTREELLLRPGVVGAPGLPRLQASVIPLHQLDTLIFVTDGIRPQFADAGVFGGSPQSVADTILADYCYGNDDAVVLVARASWERRL